MPSIFVWFHITRYGIVSAAEDSHKHFRLTRRAKWWLLDAAPAAHAHYCFRGLGLTLSLGSVTEQRLILSLHTWDKWACNTQLKWWQHCKNPHLLSMKFCINTVMLFLHVGLCSDLRVTSFLHHKTRTCVTFMFFNLGSFLKSHHWKNTLLKNLWMYQELQHR